MNANFKERVHVVSGDLDEALAIWPHQYREDVIITPSGPYVVSREDFYTFCRPASRTDFDRLFRQVTGKAHSRAVLGKMRLKCRVPWVLLTEATAFFTEVWHRWRREDVLLLYYFFDENRYELRHPELVEASASYVRYEFPDTPPRSVRFGSFHLHGYEAAYHSQTDEDDDMASPGIHIVIGSLNSGGLPTIACVGSDGKRCMPISILDVFEASPAPTFEQAWLVENVPKAKMGGKTSWCSGWYS